MRSCGFDARQGLDLLLGLQATPGWLPGCLARRDGQRASPPYLVMSLGVARTDEHGRRPRRGDRGRHGRMIEAVALALAALAFAAVSGANDGSTLIALSLPNVALRPLASIGVLAAAVAIVPLMVGAASPRRCPAGSSPSRAAMARSSSSVRSSSRSGSPAPCRAVGCPPVSPSPWWAPSSARASGAASASPGARSDRLS